MKKLLFVFAVLLTSYSVYSQDFTFIRTSPETVIGDSSNTEIKSHAYINPYSGSLNIRIIRTINNLTSGWVPLGTSICNYQGCYSYVVDTITATYSASTNTDDSISIYFYCYDIIANHFVQGAGHVRLRAELVSNPSVFTEVDFRAATQQTIGIHQLSTIVKEFSLGQNYPNPFNPATKINFSIPNSDYVSLRVYDILGREVKVLVSENLTVGEYEVDFDAKGLSSGMYYYSLRAGEYVSVKKMVLVK